MPKKSNFITDSEVPNGHYFDTFGNGVNRKILKENLFQQINKENSTTYYYDSEDDLKVADLEADPDNPIYVRVAPAWRLYRITSLAPVAPYDIPLDNGATATMDRLENLRAVNVDDMKMIPFLKEGDFVETINFSDSGDDGGNLYEIGTFGTADGVVIIDLTATALQARRVNSLSLHLTDVDAMIDCPFLAEEDIVYTDWLETLGDNRGNAYEIGEFGPADGTLIIDLTGSGLQARRINDDKVVSVTGSGDISVDNTDPQSPVVEFEPVPVELETGTQGELTSALDSKGLVDDTGVAGIIGAPVVAVLAYITDDKELLDGILTPIEWDATVLDPFSMMTSPTEFTIPAWATHMRATLDYSIEQNSTGDRVGNILIDGVAYIGHGLKRTPAPTTGSANNQCQTAVVAVSPGQLVTFHAQQNSGGPLDLMAGGGNEATWALIELYSANS